MDEPTRIKRRHHVFALCDTIREPAFALHFYLRHDHVERVYENGFAHRLHALNLDVEQQVPLSIADEDGVVLEEYVVDMLVNGVLIVEVKVCSALKNEHVARLLAYMRATGFDHGLLINFGAPKLEIRKYALSESLGKQAN